MRITCLTCLVRHVVLVSTGKLRQPDGQAVLEVSVDVLINVFHLMSGIRARMSSPGASPGPLLRLITATMAEKGGFTKRAELAIATDDDGHDPAQAWGPLHLSDTKRPLSSPLRIQAENGGSDADSPIVTAGRQLLPGPPLGERTIINRTVTTPENRLDVQVSKRVEPLRSLTTGEAPQKGEIISLCCMTYHGLKNWDGMETQLESASSTRNEDEKTKTKKIIERGLIIESSLSTVGLSSSGSLAALRYGEATAVVAVEKWRFECVHSESKWNRH